MGSIGAALSVMTAALIAGNPKYAEFKEGTQQAMEQGIPLTNAFLDAVDRDADVWKRSLRALLMPRGDRIQEEIRQDTLDQAARDCSRVLLDVLRLCKEAADLLRSRRDQENAQSLADLADFRRGTIT